MSPVGGIGETIPSVLRLQKWNHWPFPVDLSEISQASISPTRRLLLLLSHQSEALILPLSFDRNYCEDYRGSDNSPSCTSTSVSAISDVKSFTWGHCGDGYRQFQDSGFRELLFVASDNRIIVHAFRDPDRNEVISGSENGGAKWVEWGPAHSRNAGGSGSPSSQKHWLRSYLIELDTFVPSGKYSAKFPAKSCASHSADVVSFDIFDSTSRFLEFLTSAGPPTDDGENQNSNCRAGASFTCSRVFTSSSHSLVGLVLTFPEESLVEKSEDHVGYAGRVLVVVLEIYQCGMQWVCSVDLQAQCPGPGSSPEWADFQFLEDFLACLTTSGMIYMWDVKSGSFLASFDVTTSLGLDPRVSSGLNQPKLSVDSDVMTSVDREVDLESEDHGSEKGVGGRVHSRTFRRLMVVSHSLLLAVLDEHGVVYVVWAADYISEKLKTFKRFIHLSQLSCWKAAGCEIGGEKQLSDFCQGQCLYVPDLIKGLSNTYHTRVVQLSKRNHLTTYWLNNYSSGLSPAARINDWEISHANARISSAPLRRIFLPLSRFNKEDTICFSPFGITRLVSSSSIEEQRACKFFHTTLHVISSVPDGGDLDLCCLSKRFYSSIPDSTSVGESIGCSFQGFLYLVSRSGLSVILPSVSISSGDMSVESIGHCQPNTFAGGKSQFMNVFAVDEVKDLGRPWQIEVLDKTLLYEGPEEAEHICLENGWDVKIAHLRRMQLALHYLKADEIEKSLDKLVDVNLAEEGILRLLFTSVYRIFCKVGSDSEVALARRLLVLAARYATKMVRSYGLLEHKKDASPYDVKKDLVTRHLQPLWQRHNLDELSNPRRLHEMAQLLEVIRNLQGRLTSKNKRLTEGMDVTRTVDTDVDASSLTIVTVDTASPGLSDVLEAPFTDQLSFTTSELVIDRPRDLALSHTKSSISSLHSHDLHVQEEDNTQRKKFIPLEAHEKMIARWEIDNIDLKAIVKDALHSGRLPLAVLQLHLQRQKELVPGKESHDSFNEVREIGRAIAYDLFVKEESGLAVETLLRLGEDLEIVLRDLLFGTVKRSLRVQIAAEMKNYGYLKSSEWRTLEQISLIERLYPSCSFWGTYLGKLKNISEAAPCFTLPETNTPKLMFLVCDDLTIECGDIDGVVTGSWSNVDNGSAEVHEDTAFPVYWVSAAIWSDAWDQSTVDRIVLDQPFQMGVHIAWESYFEYYLSHIDLEEIHKFLDVIPASLLSERTLEINLSGWHNAGNIGTDVKFSDHTRFICAAEELGPVFMHIPDVKIFRFSALNTCCSWLKMLVEQELAKRLIFLNEYWGSTAEIMPLLARAHLIIDTSKVSSKDKLSRSSLDLEVVETGEDSHSDSRIALHKLVVHFCTQYSLPNLLDLYLDHQNVVLDENSLCNLLEAAGDCQWTKWLIFSRIKGHVYEASLSNARSNQSRQMIHASNLSVLEIDEIMPTVDDMAEGGGEMAALATLMYAALPMQKCLCTGSVNRHSNVSSQCTLENLRPGLQKFPTLWRALITGCVGQEDTSLCFKSNTTNMFGKSAFSDYLNWRDTIFFSTAGDTSLVQMLPCWFPKSVRRLVKHFVQGPMGWQSLAGAVPVGESSLYRGHSFVVNSNESAAVSPINWEVAVQRSIEELFSSLEEKGFGVEHHLHRGRTLAAFSHILGLRALKLKSTSAHQERYGQAKIQSDVQAILAPLNQSEGSLLSSVVPLAIMHFEDPVLFASCTFLLELCGLSASVLRVDVAAMQRISSYYNSIRQNSHYEHVSPKGSGIHVVSQEGDFIASLVQALADDYIHHDHLHILGQSPASSKFAKEKQSSCSLMTVLQHLERASLPLMEEGKTCGYWLSNGNGDGSEFRSQQKDANLYWNLVTTFCQMHHLPPSTKYLALLANDNDWVGYLTEAQMGGFPIDVVIEVAAREFRDPRLMTHILTVLRSMYSMKKKNSSMTVTLASQCTEMFLVPENNNMVPVELFGVLADCERQKNPGEALLIKAKNLRWSLLAMIASCFPDVSPLSCLTVWLQITAARETSSIKVNDISSKIANRVGAAVEATNSLPAGGRPLTFHYNRRNPKRRRLMEPASGKSRVDGSIDIPNMSYSTVADISQELTSEDDKNNMLNEKSKVSNDDDEGLASLSNMVAVLCEQQLFLPLLRAFEMFMPSCSLLPFIRSLQTFSQMRLSEASAHLTSFSSRIKEEQFLVHINVARDGLVKTTWISSTAVKAADAMLLTCPSAYEKRCLLQLLASAEFGDGGSASAYFRRLYWKINLAEPSLRLDEDAYLGNETLDDYSLLTALEKNGRWEQARNWARQLESSGASSKGVVHHVTEAQAEAMVVEWKEYLWDVAEERYALWNHCQTLFLRYSFPPLQAGLFFLKHSEAVEKEMPAGELHEILLLALQWLSGTMTQSPPVYPLHLLQEIETRVWLLAVESEAQSKAEGDFTSANSTPYLAAGNSVSIIEQTANIVTKMDTHINAVRMRVYEKNSIREANILPNRHLQVVDSNSSQMAASSSRTKRRSKTSLQLSRPTDNADSNSEYEDIPSSPRIVRNCGELSRNMRMSEENIKIEASVSGWEEKVRPAEMERAVLSLLEFGQLTAAKQLQHKLSPDNLLQELVLIDAALKVAGITSSCTDGIINESLLDPDCLTVLHSLPACSSNHMDPIQTLESLALMCREGSGRGLCWRIIAVVKAAKVLGLTFSEAFEKRPVELLQLLSLKAQDSLEEAKLLVETHDMPPASIARILAESFLKGLLAAHRGGYMDSQREEGPAPLLWRFSDFLKWAELCPSEQEIGHALMRLVMTGQDVPHACEVELLILSHHFYKSSSCLDGVDVLVTLAANRVESYVSEGDFSCLARLVTGVSNFHALNFILNILIENDQLDLLLQKFSAADTSTGSSETITGFRMAILTSLKLFNPHDLDAFALVYHHFGLKHENAALLESRSMQHIHQWFSHRDKERHTEDLLEAMHYVIEAAEVHSSIDAGHKTYHSCARASLLSLQIRIPDLNWLELSETNARRTLVEQSRFQEALVVAEAYNLNQPSEWAPVLWNQMLKPDLIEEFVAEFVVVLPLQPSMLLELARFYRAEVAARGDQSHFSVWLSPGGLPAEWVKHLGRSFRSLLKRTRDLRLRVQLATIATGFVDVVDLCVKVLDRVPENAGPLILRRGHGGTYLPLM